MSWLKEYSTIWFVVVLGLLQLQAGVNISILQSILFDQKHVSSCRDAFMEL